MAKPSLIRQIEMSVNAINKIGSSKRSDKLVNKTKNGIYSIRYMKDVLATSKEFARWLKENHNIRMMNEIKTSHYEEYIETKRASGVSTGSLYNIESHLRKLNNGAKQQFNFKRDFITKNRIENTSAPRQTKNRSIDESTYKQFINSTSKNASDVGQLQYNLGLRIREACHIRVEHIVENENGMFLDIKNGKGITKGGKARIVPIPKEFQQKVMDLCANATPDGRLAHITESGFRNALSRFNQKSEVKIDGSHSFRHCYARKRFEQLLGAKSDLGYKYIFDKISKTDITGLYDNSLIKEIEYSMDLVHKELGHGKNRYDLARVYLQR